jgi:hypothetical protein
MGQGMSSYAEQIAFDVIAQLAAKAAVTPFAVTDYNASYDRLYVTDLEAMTPAGDPENQMQIVLAPVQTEYERNAWGGLRVTVTLGILVVIAAKVEQGEVTDTNIGNYELFVDQLCTFLMGPRTFAGGWSAKDPLPIFGDHYNGHLYEKGTFHVPILVDFFAHMEVS